MICWVWWSCSKSMEISNHTNPSESHTQGIQWASAGVWPSLTYWDTCFVVGRFRWLHIPQHWTTLLAISLPSNAEDPNFRDVMTDDLRWRWRNNNRNKVHNKWKALESSPKHPPPRPWKNDLLRNWSLVPKRWGTTALVNPRIERKFFILMSSPLNTLCFKKVYSGSQAFLFTWALFQSLYESPWNQKLGLQTFQCSPVSPRDIQKMFSINSC